MPNPSAIDVIVVPDFLGPKAAIFEVRMLFFLSSWIANAGKAANFPLHLVCIGEPPPRVLKLAKRAKANITVHQPHPLFGEIRFLNKQIGLTINPQTDHHLLLDTDFWVFSDFSDILSLGDCISAAPADHAKVPTAYWLKIYKAFGMAPPSHRIKPITGEYKIPLEHRRSHPNQDTEVFDMFPYYQGGMLYAPWACNFKTRWQENILRIRSLFQNEGSKKGGNIWSVTKSDQAGLSMTIEQLRREGTIFTRLPRIYHGNRFHIYAKEGLTVDQIKLYHATSFAKSQKYPLLNYTERLMHSMRNLWMAQHPDHSVFNYLDQYAFRHTKAVVSLIWKMWRLSNFK